MPSLLKAPTLAWSKRVLTFFQSPSLLDLHRDLHNHLQPRSGFIHVLLSFPDRSADWMLAYSVGGSERSSLYGRSHPAVEGGRISTFDRLTALLQERSRAHRARQRRRTCTPTPSLVVDTLANKKPV